MPTALTVKATEESTYIVSMAFTDAAGDAVTPDTGTYTLTDSSGTVINSLEDVDLAGSLASSMDVVLSGDDLAVTESGNATRVFTFKGTYTSDEGSGLPLKAACSFVVENLIAES